ncbi:MAG: hypothetical protein AMJ75_01975 [Phycisphaerae bacterium SM1_79]|nr:MAG: hypothetical protein AMJ75_01975 [Phycisphaerae bacterium SM1_79]
MLNMEKLRIMVRHELIVLCLVGTAWVFMLSLLLWTTVRFRASLIVLFPLICMLPLQLSLTNLYTDYKVASVKNELLRELRKTGLGPISSEPQTAMKIFSYKAIYLAIVGAVVIGIVWYIVHKLMVSLE